MTLTPRPLLVALTLFAVLTVTSGFLLAIAPAPLTAADAQPAGERTGRHIARDGTGRTAPTELAFAQ